jgi:hypothetical protein
MTKDEGRQDRHSRVNPAIAAAAIGAIATVAAAFLGNGGGFTRILPGSPTITVTAAPKPNVTVTVTAPPDGASASQPSGVYHQGKLILVGNDADLDSAPSDPQWGIIKLAPGDQYDISGYGNTAIFLENNAQGVQLASATDSSCAQVTGYSTGRLGIDTPPLRIGQFICVHTTEGRFSLLKILSLPTNEIVLFVTTFKDTSG